MERTYTGIYPDAAERELAGARSSHGLPRDGHARDRPGRSTACAVGPEEERSAVPLPRWVARANRRGLNRVAGPLAGQVPPFARVVHRGRRSGAEYQTPVMAFSAGNRFAIALTYGPEADWVKNVRAAGGGALVRRGRRIEIISPRLVRSSEGPPMIPAAIRSILQLLRVDEFLILDQPPTAANAEPAHEIPEG